MLYRIEFEVDDGCTYGEDTALVLAQGYDEAKEKLHKYINSLDSETCISRVFSISPFEGEVFTGRHGYSKEVLERSKRVGDKQFNSTVDDVILT